MRFTDKTNLLEGCYLDIIYIENKKLHYCNYFEDHIFNQDGELLIIGCTRYKNTSYTTVIEVVK